MAVFRVPINLAWDGPGTPGVNVWHVRTVGPSDLVDLQQGVDAIRTFYNSLNGAGSGAASIYPTGFTANIGQAVNVVDQSTLQPTFTQITGAGAATEAPQVLQICVSWRTSIAARRGMGRTFLGVLKSTAMQSDGTIDPSITTTCRNAATALVTASVLDTNGWAVGVYGLSVPAPAGAEPGSGARVLRDITGSSVRDRFAVLRSRRD